MKLLKRAIHLAARTANLFPDEDHSSFLEQVVKAEFQDCLDFCSDYESYSIVTPMLMVD